MPVSNRQPVKEGALARVLAAPGSACEYTDFGEPSRRCLFGEGERAPNDRRLFCCRGVEGTELELRYVR